MQDSNENLLNLSNQTLGDDSIVIFKIDDKLIHY